MSVLSAGTHKRIEQYLHGNLWDRLVRLFLLFFCPPSWDVAVGKAVARDLTCGPGVVLQCIRKGQKLL